MGRSRHRGRALCEDRLEVRGEHTGAEFRHCGVHRRSGWAGNRGHSQHRAPDACRRCRKGDGEAVRRRPCTAGPRRSPALQADSGDWRGRLLRGEPRGQPGEGFAQATRRAAVDRSRIGDSGRWTPMKANCWVSPNKVEVRDVPEPKILNGRDAIIEITSTAICGSDLHLYDGYIPSMKSGDILGHEFMGRVVETGHGVHNLNVGNRVVVPFPIACGACNACQRGLTSLCENSNPNAALAEKTFGFPTSGIFGYSHLTGGFAGGQAQYARVPFADVGPLKIENDDLPDEKVLFLSDILPTGYMGAEMCDIQDGDVVAVWGAGPVGQFAMDSARVLGAAMVIAIDDVPYRLEMAASQGYRTIDYSNTDVRSALLELTGGRGPDKCIDAVGMEATHGAAHVHLYDRLKQAVRSETDRPHALRQAILSCRSGGIVSGIGGYGGLVDKFPAGARVNPSLTLRTGQCHVQRYMRPLLDRIERGEIDPIRVITHRLPLAEAPHGYDIFKNKADGCEKVVLKP